jgi:hypothetical protein
MANRVHQRITVVEGSAEEVLKFLSQQDGVIDPVIYTTRLKPRDTSEEEVKRVQVTNASPSVGFDTKWEPLKESQVNALLTAFPTYELIFHLSEELGNWSDEEYHFVKGEQVKHIVFPNWRMEIEADSVAASR